MGIFRPKPEPDFISFLDNTPDPLIRGRGRLIANAQSGGVRPSIWTIIHDTITQPSPRFMRGYGPSALTNSTTMENDPREEMTMDTYDPVAGPEIWEQVGPSAMPYIDPSVEGARI